MLTREQILSATDIKSEIVQVPEWGGELMVWGMTGKERDAFERTVLERREDGSLKRNYENFRAKLAVFSIKDETGKRLFDESDIEALGKKSVAALERVINVAQRLSRISSEDTENLVKN